MCFCYCCVYGDLIEPGKYICTNYDSFENNTETSDVGCCNDYVFDDQFIETPHDVEVYGKCYLKDICVEKLCEL